MLPGSPSNFIPKQGYRFYNLVTHVLSTDMNLCGVVAVDWYKPMVRQGCRLPYRVRNKGLTDRIALDGKAFSFSRTKLNSYQCTMFNSSKVKCNSFSPCRNEIMN